MPYKEIARSAYTPLKQAGIIHASRYRQRVVLTFIFVCIVVSTLIYSSRLVEKSNYVVMPEQLGQNRKRAALQALNASEQETETSQKDQIPKVALLFLARGEMKTEPVWTQFFKVAGEVRLKAPPPQPYVGFYEEDLREYLKQDLFPKEQVDWDEVNTTCWEHPSGKFVGYISPKRSTFKNDTIKLISPQSKHPPDIIDQQLLFTVYVHTKPDFEGFPDKSIFKEKVIQDLVYTEIATFSLIEAERRLLKAALENPLNTRFVLLSDTCLPIYHPAAIYAQIMSEQQSRVDGCTVGKMSYRWADIMGTEYFTFKTFRKSSQWWMLIRPHAVLAIADKHVDARMQTYCSTKLSCNSTRFAHVCVPDESYFPSLLATYGLDNETDCVGKITGADWTGQDWHPKEFRGSQVNTKLIYNLRKEGCYEQLQNSQVQKLYELNSRKEQTSAENFGSDWSVYQPINSTCPLFGRKFPTYSSVSGAMSIAKACKGLQLNTSCILQNNNNAQ